MVNVEQKRLKRRALKELMAGRSSPEAGANLVKLKDHFARYFEGVGEKANFKADFYACRNDAETLRFLKSIYKKLHAKLSENERSSVETTFLIVELQLKEEGKKLKDKK